MKNKIFLILGIALAVGLIWYKLSINTKNAKKEIEAEKAAIPFAVEAAAVRLASFSDTISYPGVAEATGTVNMLSETDGRVLRVHIANGSSVKKGELIAVIDNAMKVPGLQIHQIEYNKAKTDYNRYAELYKQNNATGVELENARHAVEAAEKQLKLAQTEIGKGNIYAPTSGVVANKSINPGDFLSIGSPVAVIVPLTKVELRVQVPENEINKIHVGQSVHFTTDAYGDRKFTGTITAIIPTANQAKRFPVLVSVSNSQHGVTLMGGMTVNVLVQDPKTDSAIIIPRVAVKGDMSAPFVWRVDKDKKATKQSIKLGKDRNGEAEVLSGLRVGDIVVSKGQANITEGMTLGSLKIVESKQSSKTN